MRPAERLDDEVSDPIPRRPTARLLRVIVVLDTNALFSDFHMSRPHMDMICRHVGAGQLRLGVPELVIRETVNKYKDEVAAVMSLEVV